MTEPIVGKNRGNAGKGRPKGSLNKATSEIMEMAQSFGPDALAVLVDMMLSEDAPEAARIKAAETVLDRAYGKASQHIDHTFDPAEIAGMTDKAKLAAIVAGRA